MDRRAVLGSAVALAAAGVPGAVTSHAALPRRQDARAEPGSWIRTHDGQSLHYKDWGTGAPMVFLAAWALPSDMWDYQMVPLSAQNLRCVAYDRRGHGRSSRPGVGYDYDSLADDLAAVLDTLDLRDVTLVGMSMAAGEMVRYVTRHGAGRIARLVFVATAATPFRTRTPDNPRGIPAGQLDAFRNHVLLRDYPKWLEDNRPPFFVPETSPQMQDWIKTLMLGTSMKALVECSRSMSSTDFRAELRKISVPTLLIHGDKDVSAPIDLTGRLTAELIPRAQLKVYEGAPHGLFVTHMARLTADLLAFARS
ncbi:MAG TPA: alpha/beta fold hydrolase [Vicinamibacterales bacterium]|nr:alpha/beta fold hydrolase [Vicinamibacterales bacterium]